MQYLPLGSPEAIPQIIHAPITDGIAFIYVYQNANKKLSEVFFEPASRFELCLNQPQSLRLSINSTLKNLKKYKLRDDFEVDERIKFPPTEET